MQRLVFFLVFSIFLGNIRADVVFTWPCPGSTLGSGDVSVWWEEDSGALLVQEMASHLLVLFTGSDSVLEILNEWAIPVGSYNATIHLDSNIGPNANNSYFFGIQSNPVNISIYPSDAIPVLTNFSPRFSLANMTGEDFSPAISAANAERDSTDGPDSLIRDESQDQVSLAMASIHSLSSAQITTSGAIHNPTDGVLVTNLPLTPTTSPSTLPSALVTTIISTPESASPQSFSETPTQTPTSTTNTHKKIVIAIPVAISVAAVIVLSLFFIIRHRRRRPPTEKIDPDGSILPFFPPPPTHPNTWMDTKASTFKDKSNRFWHLLKAKRSRGSVAELPGYEGPGTLKPASQRNTSLSGATGTKTSSMACKPIEITPNATTSVSLTKVQNPQKSLPGREVGFLALGPDSTRNDSQHSDIKAPITLTRINHSFRSASTIKTITTESSGIPSSSVLSDRERERVPSHSDLGTPFSGERVAQMPPQPPSPTALRGMAKVVTISRSNSLLYSGSNPVATPQASADYPTRNSSLPRGAPKGYTFSNPALAYQKPLCQSQTSFHLQQTSFSPLSTSIPPPVSQTKSFRSPMERMDESAAVREAEKRIRGFLGSNAGNSSGNEGVVSPVSPVSPLSSSR
ncbi:2c61fe9e-05ec-45d5-b84e-92f6714da134 [Sclerotinia trifoliorum]|uniref:2c61fe9e-05ec-45d5-b84e-92f6714da134 n=1 Tax=Sclerotinia trifoliorum TaxID=28548 RepID=A0A8H2ZSJ5_9HELO|nr:2c61fe9e-05ec-45d5-b84e-92f6714da134 [Sclerotinia trifoliorum]